MEEALSFIEDLLAVPSVRLLHTDGGHWSELKRVLEESAVPGRTITDAQFAALALQHHGTLYTTDRHFQRFPGLRWRNPLTGGTKP